MTTAVRFTKKEKLAVLKGALKLIRNEENWTPGKWICPVTTWDENLGEYVPLMKSGKPVAQFCIEGALNVAAVDILGAERANKLGAVSVNDEGLLTWDRDNLRFYENTVMANLTSLDSLALEVYGQAWQERSGDPNATPTALALNDDSTFGHEAVTNLLKLKIKRVEKEIATAEKRKARKKELVTA